MKNYWLLKENFNKLILIRESTIFTGNVKNIDEIKLISDIEKGTIQKNLFSIPYSYIRSIENQEGNNTIKINFGKDSEEELKIRDRKIKNEIFELLKNDLSKFEYSQKIPSIIKQAKPQIFAILFTTGLFLWTFYIANQIENGYEYEVIGGRPGIGGIILILAQFGTLKVILGYIVILSIAIYSFIRKIKNRSLTEYLIRVE